MRALYLVIAALAFCSLSCGGICGTARDALIAREATELDACLVEHADEQGARECALEVRRRFDLAHQALTGERGRGEDSP